MTVPGAVSGGWRCSSGFGSVGLDRCLVPAIDAAEQGFAVTPVIAGPVGQAMRPASTDDEAGGSSATRRGRQIARLAELGQSLRLLASHGPAALLRRNARAMPSARASWLERADLATHEPERVEPCAWLTAASRCSSCRRTDRARWRCKRSRSSSRSPRRDAADRVHLQAEALKLAFADGYRYVADEPLPAGYLDPAYIAERRALIDRERAGSPRPGALPRGGTVYLCCVDGERRACSLIQSLYYGFGSWSRRPGDGDHAAEPGRVLHAQPGHPNRIAPARRPFNTIIPGMLVRDGSLLGPFGVMGGHFQPQGHLQVVERLLVDGADPQRARTHRASGSISRTPGGRSRSTPLWTLEAELTRRGHRVRRRSGPSGFGGGQVVLVRDDVLEGGSEPRKDGDAAGI